MMDIGQLLRIIPLWVSYSGTAVLIVCSIYAGFAFSRTRRKKKPEESETAINTIVAATLGLLAFILAFTFGVTTSRFDSRKDLMLDEVNAIETTYLRAGLIPEPHRSDVRLLLQRYVEIRVDLAADPGIASQVIEESDHLQQQLWDHVESLAGMELANPDIVSLFVDSMNQMFDLQTKRITVGMIFRLPPVFWIALYLLTILSMLEVGYLFGTSGQAPNLLMVILLSLSFSAVIMLVVDLDRSGSGKPGIIKITGRPMVDLQERMNRPM
jgi:hypothetical protein